jgi:mannose-6-phosphate isomerase
MMTALYPLFFSPVLKHYMWGGRNLEKLGRHLPDESQVAESWEIASHLDGMTVITNGVFQGKTLPQLMEILGLDLVGSNNQWAFDRKIFPLMVKLLDAERRLSVQVHPDDVYARENEGNELGKAEMWVVLWAEPGAEIIYGFSKETTPKDLRRAISNGRLEPYLHKIPVKAGDHICVPPGSLHAILEGVMLVEIQQNSNTTYRVFDWNRTDNSGKARSLHVDKALGVINYQQVDVSLPQAKAIASTAQWQREQLCQNRYFTTERITFYDEAQYRGNCDGSSLEIWGVISGRAEIAGELIEGVRFCLLPAALGEYRVQAGPNTTLLRVYTPSF